ncbi:tRNA (5-methylaminomethyl-2-thiouridine)(34)-methyltransferase MnmD [Capnocytophaga catalasegens]|uniref:MnmC-like methyltransferase domain-containing protein n=1 Tax=Capnocytophaga catalasegens TaxID=1004260 RepID=A0AAV5AR09_9FLAO|nr:tRNA (5-methylaminomethyl-2-thiouridine)(34)-methyltransferase MnmD [Capnocytophaga catalasegens]GIZ15206.1 hypothetical protein RCZ03_12060 [Capnocytophaga catalasegens]GJM49721.1 hypothetical protein RCZ15_06960 [Capnocytophaga catalasegens]GJM52786.1 hypothetical protein RCZ16_11030 [Capnocytophaga catalasegens]
MKRNIIITADGSTTIQVEEWNEHYHSIHGAIQEAYHVFIKNGLQLFAGQNISILEIGLGTGLNAFITFLEHQKLNQHIHYQGIEAYPVSIEQALQMNYVQELKTDEFLPIFEKLHTSEWEKNIVLTETFSFRKRQQHFQEITDTDGFHLIYYDAFGARVQPELWTNILFEKMHKALKTNGILVTYSAKGSVRRAMIDVGFEVEKLPGPPRKREMLRAVKK